MKIIHSYEAPPLIIEKINSYLKTVNDKNFLSSRAVYSANFISNSKQQHIDQLDETIRQFTFFDENVIIIKNQIKLDTVQQAYNYYKIISLLFMHWNWTKSVNNNVKLNNFSVTYVNNHQNVTKKINTIIFITDKTNYVYNLCKRELILINRK